MLRFIQEAYDATPTSVGTGIPSPDYWGLILFFILFFAVFIGGMYLLKRIRSGPARGGGIAADRCLERIEALALTPGTRLALVRAGQRYFLLGVGDKHVTALAELSAEDIASTISGASQNAGINALLRNLGQDAPEKARDVLEHDPVPWQTKKRREPEKRGVNDRLMQLEEMMERRRERARQSDKDYPE